MKVLSKYQGLWAHYEPCEPHIYVNKGEVDLPQWLAEDMINQGLADHIKKQITPESYENKMIDTEKKQNKTKRGRKPKKK